MNQQTDHRIVVGVDMAGTEGALPVPAVRHLPDLPPVRAVTPAVIATPAAAVAGHRVDRFHAAAGLLLAALGALLYFLSLGCGEELEAVLAAIGGCGGAALAMWALIPGLTILEPAGRAVFTVLRPICWAATVMPRTAALITWLVLVAGVLVALARSWGAPC